MTIQVDGPAPQPSILGFDAFYCYKDTTYVLSALPSGGIWSNAATTACLIQLHLIQVCQQ